MRNDSLSNLTKNFLKRLSLVMVFVFVVCVCTSVTVYLYHSSRLIAVVANSIREFLVVGDQRVATKIIALALEHGFTGIQVCPAENKSILPRCLNVGTSGNSFAEYNVVAKIYWSADDLNPLASIIGVVSLQVPIFFGVGIWVLVFVISLPLVFQMRRGLVRSYLASLQERADLNYATVAKQIVHDIRSPLSALKIGIETITLENFNRNVGLLRLALNRIIGLTNDLDQRSSRFKNFQPEHFFDIEQLIDSLVAEKNLEFDGLSPVIFSVENFDDTGSFVLGRDLDFRRVVSNIINNAREAMANRSDSIIVLLKLQNKYACLDVEDSGVGFEADVLEKVAKGILLSTKGGQGLGLSHARTVVSDMGGKLDIVSTKGLGTKVVINLPIFVPEGDLPQRISLI